MFRRFGRDRRDRGRRRTVRPQRRDTPSERRTQRLPVEVVESALSDDSGSAEFASPTEDVCGAASIGSPGIHGERVRTERGDGSVRDGAIPAPTVVKIDVEGAEPLVLDGMRRTLADDRCRLVYCEEHHPHPNRPPSADFGASLDAIARTSNRWGSRSRRSKRGRGNATQIEKVRDAVALDADAAVMPVGSLDGPVTSSGSRHPRQAHVRTSPQNECRLPDLNRGQLDLQSSALPV